MRLLRTDLRSRSLVRSCVAAAAGVALTVPLASAAGAADGGSPSPGVVPLAAVEPSEYVTVDEPFQAPALTTSPTGREDPGLLMLAPGGGVSGSAALYDNSGQVVWELPGRYFNFEQITYLGEPALVMYDTQRGAHVVYDETYTEIATVQLVDQPTDGHDIAFSPDGSRVLVEGWVRQQIDLSEWGGPANGMIGNTVIQELDVATGEVLFEWDALDHISPDETQSPLTGSDLFHTNSIAYDNDGNVLTSFRNCSTVYKIDIETGEIVWRFGGENSDFTFPGGEADMPSFQHDAQRLPDGSLSVFDNGNEHDPQESRGAVWEIDESTMTATLTQDLRADPAAFTPFIGNNRQVPNGNQLVNYGIAGRMVEFAAGEPVFTAQFEGGGSSYRADRTHDWVGLPAAPPEVVVGQPAKDGTRTLNVSWNGATEVDSWRVLAGPSQEALTALGTAPRTGFETAARISAPEGTSVLRVVALDAAGEPLGSRTVTVG